MALAVNKQVTTSSGYIQPSIVVEIVTSTAQAISSDKQAVIARPIITIHSLAALVVLACFLYSSEHTGILGWFCMAAAY